MDRAPQSATARASTRGDMATSSSTVAMLIELDVYNASSRSTRAIASRRWTNEGEEEASTSLSDDGDEWVARAGTETRGRLRMTASSANARVMDIDAVTVEWYGVEQLDERWKRRTKGEEDEDARAVGAKPGERYVARSPPGEVARAVEIAPGKTVSFKFGVDLPPGLAPSFKGQAVRYRYEVVCAATTVSGERVEIRAPLTVRTNSAGLEFKNESESDDDMSLLTETFSMADLNAPWIREEGSHPPESPTFSGGAFNSPRALTTSAVWEDVGSPQSPRLSTSDFHLRPKTAPVGRARGAKSKAYIVSMGDDKLMKVLLRKPAPKCSIGGELAGILDFTCADKAKAESIVITLESEEIIHAGTASSLDGRPPTFRKIWIETSECVEQLDTSHFVMTLPLNSPGNFRTSRVELKWLLRFEIRVVRKKPAGEFAAFFRGINESLEYSTVEWVFPLDVGTAIPRSDDMDTLHRYSSLVTDDDER